MDCIHRPRHCTGNGTSLLGRVCPTSAARVHGQHGIDHGRLGQFLRWCGQLRGGIHGSGPSGTAYPDRSAVYTPCFGTCYDFLPTGEVSFSWD